MKTNDEWYEEARALCGAALQRMARGYEADPERCRDLLQEIHLELWRSLRLYDERCGLRTWVFRVAHNVAASHIVRERRTRSRLVELEALEALPGSVDGEGAAARRHAVGQLLERIHRLKPLDRQVILLYLEGEAAGAIAEITGISPSNVAVRIHRIKKLLHREPEGGTIDAGR